MKVAKRLSVKDKEIMEDLTARLMTVQELLEHVVELGVSGEAINYLTAIYRHTVEMKSMVVERRRTS